MNWLDFENKIKNDFRKPKWFIKKILIGTGQGHNIKQEADFIMANDNGVYFVEAKFRETERFIFNDLTQEKKLTLVTKKTSQIQPIIVIGFPKQKKLVILSLNQFKHLKDNTFFKNGKQKKSITIKDIPNEYIFKWNGLVDYFKK